MTLDLLQQAGPLGLGSRLKRLSDVLFNQVSELYHQKELSIDSRIFPVLYALGSADGQGIVELSKLLGISHASVSLLVKAAKKAGVVQVKKPQRDERCRDVYLTEKGRDLIRTLQPIWTKIEENLGERLSSLAPNFLSELHVLERSLLEDPLSRATPAAALLDPEIVPYDSQYRAAFRDLNLEWIESIFEVEAQDRKVLEDPDAYYIQKRGMIFFAKLSGAVVGTGAIFPTGHAHEFCLEKMAVSPLARGKGIGRKLLFALTDWAKGQGAERIVLETSTKLPQAISLYRSVGFQLYRKEQQSDYKRADYPMELELYS